LSGDGPDLGDYLAEHRYGAAFVDDHLLPMVCALWSSPSCQALRFPAKYLAQFMANHHMLQISDRPQWRVVRGGSSSYVRAMAATWRASVRLGATVNEVRRTPDAVEVVSADAVERFDQVVLACHSDQALALLHAPTDAEREILGAIGYQSNDTVLHTDARMLPRDRRAWAAWNALVPAQDGGECTVSYCMNLLQSLSAPEPLVVTLNGTDAIDPDKILARMRYHHPIYTRRSVAAQARRGEINGRDRIWYAGAYWGWGFHEDGLRSAVEVAAGLGVPWS
jgi:predicted NAD/FAD-binding protein